MIILKSATGYQDFVTKKAAFPLKTGFIPTMGALHKGHLALIEACRKEQELTVVSIFVNPTQFNDPADFNNYPITIERDIALLEKAGCDILFLPAMDEIYPAGTANQPFYQLGDLETVLEGYYRPGHFQGVCQVMDRLLTIVAPGHLYMGSKDYQQCLVVKKLMQLAGFTTAFHMVDTVREPDGLAMSSRNVRLSETQRRQAPEIYRQLQFIQKYCSTIGIAELQSAAYNNLLQAGFTSVDYVSIADAETLQPLSMIGEGLTARVLVAAFMGNVRLIDNKEITV